MPHISPNKLIFEKTPIITNTVLPRILTLNKPNFLMDGKVAITYLALRKHLFDIASKLGKIVMMI